MPTPIITINYVTLWDDARANTWKTGRIAPREDGLHTEEQMSDAAMDMKIACRLFFEGTCQLHNITKDFRTQADCISRLADGDTGYDIPGPTSSNGDDSNPAGVYYSLSGYLTDEEGDYYTNAVIQLTKINARANATNAELSALAHEYVLAYTMREWYKMVDPSRMASWERRRADAELRILRACRYKQKLN